MVALSIRSERFSGCLLVGTLDICSCGARVKREVGLCIVEKCKSAFTKKEV